MSWYCIHTRPQQEESICQYFEDALGVETYFPKLREQRVIRRVKRTVVRPLFPRYLFCRFDAAIHYRAVRYAPDVIDVVHFGPAPAIVPDTALGELKSWVGECLDLSQPKPDLQSGDVVMLGEGPLAGLRAVVQQVMSDSDRVAVLLSFLDCGARTVVSRAQLELVS
jgi:transcriptional antiterminator RfaH